MPDPNWPGEGANANAYPVSAEANISTAIDDTFTRPGSVRINVTGAFIVSDGSVTPQVHEEDGVVHDTGDIRLPHHTAVVSHVAVDVPLPPPLTRLNILTAIATDWGLPRQTGLLHPRTPFPFARRTAQLPEIRDGSH